MWILILKSNCIKNEGFALPFILFITLLVVSMLLGLISILFFLNNVESKKIKKKKLDLACTSAVQMLLSSEDSLVIGEKTIQTGKYPVFMEIKGKGLFYEITAGTNGGSDSSKVKYLIGYSNYFEENIALVISRPGLRATVAGDTKIEGDIVSAADKINKGKIFGIENNTDSFIDGRLISENSIPSKILDETIVTGQLPFSAEEDDNEEIFIDGDLILSQSAVGNIDCTKEIAVQGNLIISRSITANPGIGTIRLKVSGETVIEDNTQSNLDLEIKCDSIIRVGNNVKLQNAILAAEGEVQAENSYFKNVQIFSADTIKINNSQFDYPSVICLYTDAGKVSALKNSLIIRSSVINGMVMLISSVTGLSQNKSMIDIDEKSIVQGLVYSENNLRMPSTVNGIVYTYNFWYYQNPTEYINWLVNVKIDREKLSQWFLLPRGFSGSIKPGILKEQWIY
jgi:hypothetical protein